MSSRLPRRPAEGATQAATPDVVRELTRDEMGKLMSAPEFSEAVTLLSGNLVLNDGRAERALNIREVEPFTELLRKDMIADFDSRPREFGQTFITWSRGFPQLNVVVDPEKKSVVQIRLIEENGKPVTFNGILSQLDLAKQGGEDFKSYKTRVNAKLDGINLSDTDPSQILKLADSAKAVHQIRQRVQEDTAQNSLGRFVATE